MTHDHAASPRPAGLVWPGPGSVLRRSVILLVLALTASLLQATVFPSVVDAAIDPTREADFVALVNVERAKHDLPALVPRADIRDVARRHSVVMANESRLHHNPSFSTQISGWQVVAENVGRGPSVDSLHRALMASEGHRANILNDRVTEIGVGVEVRDGNVWVTQNFRRPQGTVLAGTPSTTLYGDVPSTSVHRTGILAITANGVADACGIARFCPDDDVTRAEFVVMLAKSMDVSPAGSSRFTDMEGAAAGYAEALAALGVVAGTTATTFAPDRKLTREQLASLLARSLGLSPRPPPFADVTSTHAGNVGALAARGVVRGCAIDRFCPTDRVTRAQVATMLVNEFGA